MYSSRVLLALFVSLAATALAVPTRELKQAKIVRAEPVGKRQDDPDFKFPKPSKHYKARDAEATPDWYPKPSKHYKARSPEATPDYKPKPSKQYKARAPEVTPRAEIDLD
ncbi:hypothetical protein OF83DRAFT_1168943 [Amylostereum chailletii]|nr:hypothetical protein OF83DRAFT_1168943 [Amylostereum chailletii]